MKKEKISVSDAVLLVLKVLVILGFLIEIKWFFIFGIVIIFLIFIYEGKAYADKVAYEVFDGEYEDLINKITNEVRGINVSANDYKYILNKINNILTNYDVAMTYLETQVSNTQVIFYYTLGFTYGANSKKKFTKISQVEALKPEIELSLGEPIRLISDKDKLGIAIVNPEFKSLSFKDMVEDPGYKKLIKKYNDGLPFCLGYGTNDELICGDATKFPHLLIAGETNSGKSNALQVMITSMLINKKPSELKLMLADFKLVELVAFKDSEYLIGDISYDIESFHAQLDYLTNLTTQRLEKLQSVNVKNIQEYNKSATKPLPFVLLVIEELASLMMIDDAKLKTELENKLSVLASKCRAVGIHIIITTQKPQKKIVTGSIKTNIPGRLALKVVDDVDSQLIIGNSEATRLRGNGDAILNGKRLQIAFLDSAVQKEYLK